MEDIYAVGVGMTAFGKLADINIKQLTRQAVASALADSGLMTRDIEGAFFSNAVQGHMEGQHLIRGQIALREIGVQGVPVVNVENACASASSAFNLAVNFLRAGAGDVALVVGAEKMYSDDRARMFGAFDSAWDVSSADRIRQQLVMMGEGVEVPPGTTSSSPYSVFMDVYAALRDSICGPSGLPNGRSRRLRPRITTIPFTIRLRSIADPLRSTKCLPQRLLPIR